MPRATIRLIAAGALALSLACPGPPNKRDPPPPNRRAKRTPRPHLRPAVPPVCHWSKRCLDRLERAVRNRDNDTHRTVLALLVKIDKPFIPVECEATPSRIAKRFAIRPWFWKPRCGPPPVAGVTRITDRSNPFTVVDKQIKDSVVSKDEPPAVRATHSGYPDVCKAWVKFRLNRNFQGFVVVQVYEQFDCQPTTKGAPPRCKTRPYPKKVRLYIPYHAKGSTFSHNFYFSTPPAVCRKPQLTNRTYKAGCYCLGIDKSRLELQWADDPFLFRDGPPLRAVSP